MLEAQGGQGDFPRVRTFRQFDTSTNNVFDDLKEAERWTGVQGKVDMAELTWEQRERILRMMFAKMNGFKEKRRYVVSTSCSFCQILMCWGGFFLNGTDFVEFKLMADHATCIVKVTQRQLCKQADCNIK